MTTLLVVLAVMLWLAAVAFTLATVHAGARADAWERENRRTNDRTR